MNSSEITAPVPRKFVAPTSREALRLARKSLGESAVVLATRPLRDGVEIVAMADDDRASLVQAAEAAPATRSAPPAANVLAELQSMRSMIEEHLGSAAWKEQQRADPVRGRLLRTMLAAGFSATLSKAMLERMPFGHTYAQGLEFARSELLRTVPVQGDETALMEQGGVYALVGPTGVGKTTTTAKLAARCVMHFGADKLALVTTDGYRIGAYEQLRIYGQILNLPVHAVKNAANLRAVLDGLGDKHMVLIDTVGMSQRDRAVADQIGMLCSAGRPVRRLLLLNAASHGDTLNEVVYAYQQANQGNGLAGCIFTKMDEATSYGALLDTVIRHRLPVHYISDGQKVPENLLVADGARLVEDVLDVTPPRDALFVCDPALAQEGAADARGELARAKAQSERLRHGYDQLIRAMAHDAQEISDASRALDEAGIGFAQARLLWASAAHEEIDPAQTAHRVLLEARREALVNCQSHILAVSGRPSLDPDAQGTPVHVQSTVLLGDRDGRPFAAPNHWAGAGPQVPSDFTAVRWLQGQELGKPLVHWPATMLSNEDLAAWAVQEASWAARVSGATVVTDPATGASVPLSQLEASFGAGEPLTFRRKAAQRAVGQARVRVKLADGTERPLRCVVQRTVAVDGGRPLEHLFLLTNVGDDIPCRAIAKWQEWAAGAEACFRLIGKGASLLGGVGAGDAAEATKRVLIAGQVATTVWRLLQGGGERMERPRRLLTELAGRQVRPDRPHTGTALYEGLAKLFCLLEALAWDSPDESCGEVAP